MRFPRKSKIPERQKRGFFSSLESAYTKGALSTFPPPRRLLHFLRIQPRKELSSATLSAPLQAHPSIGKDCIILRRAVGRRNPEPVYPGRTLKYKKMGGVRK